MKKLILFVLLCTCCTGFGQSVRDVTTQDFDTYDIWIRPFKMLKRIPTPAGQTVTPKQFLGSIHLDTLAKKVGLRVFGVMNINNTLDIDKPLSNAAIGAFSQKANGFSPSFTGTVSGITKAMVGLPNLDNTSDANKPISTATQAALGSKADVNNPNFTGTVSGITKAMVGLSNLDNTSDATKPISTATQAALGSKADQIYTEKKLHFVHAVSDLQALTNINICHFDGSTWKKFVGNVQSNGIDNFGTIVRIDANSYWRRIDNVISDYSTNLFIGEYAGASNTPIAANVGRQNTFIGFNAGRFGTTGYAKTFVGYNAGYNETIATGNTYLGYQTAFNNVLGSFNTAVGTDAGYMNTADRNSFFGWHSGFGSINGIITGSDNHFLGYETAQKLTSGYGNNAHGSRSLYHVTTGFNNSTFGQYAGFALTGGSDNSLYGMESGQAQTTAIQNTFMGQRSGFYTTVGGSNSGLGVRSLFGNTTGQLNTGVGGSSGELNVTGTGNTFIGFNAGNVVGQKPDGFFSTALGYGAITTKNYQMVLGSIDVGETVIRGSTLINTETKIPSAILNIESSTQGVLFPRLTQTQRNAISSPAAWIQIICTDCVATDTSAGVLQIFNGSVWKNAY